MLLLLLLPLILVFFLIHTSERIRYQKTEYFIQTRIPFRHIVWDKGSLGEYYIYSSLTPLPGSKRFLFNCYIPKPNGETTEIDVIMIHSSGIYVFESKNYGGWIFGKDTDRYWTQTLPAGYDRSVKNRFFNPVIQNEIHVQWLKAYLQDESIPFFSFVVFSDRCTLKQITLSRPGHRVIYRFALSYQVQSVANQSQAFLTPEKIQVLYDKLFPLANPDIAKKFSHVTAIYQKYQAFPDPINDKICPRCGGKLVIRTAQKGKYAGKAFWGCVNYPKCRYIQNIDQ